jgi:hypothetical protein
MRNETFMVIRILASGAFIAALYAGYYLLKNYKKLFGVDPNMPSETPGSRSFGATLVFLIWAHVLIGSVACALALH